MQLIYYPAPILLQQCKSVLNSGKGQRRKDRLDLANKMWKIMWKNHGLGLAASQVGLNIRMFVWNHKNSQIYNQAIMLQKTGLTISLKRYEGIWNPVLSSINGCEESVEGCLSLPGVNVTIQRATSSILSGTGLNGKPVQFIGDAVLTRIWQHEINHLDGKLIIDNMSHEDAVANREALKVLLKNSIH